MLWPCNELTCADEGSMVITTSLDSETSSGDRFVGIPSSENFFMAFSLLNIIGSVFVGWSIIIYIFEL
jgi:hypothetical protein